MGGLDKQSEPASIGGNQVANPSELLREGWKQYEQDVQLFNAKKMKEWADRQSENTVKGKYVQSSPPSPKQPSLEDFRYWVWQSGDYADTAVSDLVSTNGAGSTTASNPPKESP